MGTKLKRFTMLRMYWWVVCFVFRERRAPTEEECMEKLLTYMVLRKK